MSKLDTRLPVCLLADGTLAIPSRKMKRVSVKQLGHIIREGYAIRVYKNLEDGSTIDLTQEHLVRIAMFDHPGDHEKKVRAVLTALELAEHLSESPELTEDTLYMIIENGGLSNYLDRKARGLIQYGN